MTATLERWKSRAARAQHNREAMPECAAWIDELRKEFPAAHITFAQENGITLGLRGDEGVAPVLMQHTTTERRR